MDSSMTDYIFYIPIIVWIIIIGVIITKGVSVTKEAKRKQERIIKTYPETINKYYNVLNSEPTLSTQRSKYIKFKKQATTIIIIGILFFPIEVILANQLNLLYLVQTLFYAPLAICIFGVIKLNKASKIADEYSKHYKYNIMKKAIKEFNPNLEYIPDGLIPEIFYRQANFENYDRYYSEDKITGIINKNEFVMADVHVKDKRKDSDGNTYYVTLFHGPVAITTLPEHINLNLAIVNNKLTKYYDSAPKIEIDNPIFEDVYDIFADNQITAMRILTPSITNKILDLYRKYDFKFEVKIQKNILYFRFHCGQLFEPNISSIEKEVISITKYFEILKGIEEMITEFMKAIDFLKNK